MPTGRLRVNPGPLSILAAGLLAWAAVLVVIAVLGRDRIVPAYFNQLRAEHFISFYVLGYLAAAALPGVRLRILFGWLVVLATAVEMARVWVFQDLGQQFTDWVCNVLGAGAALAPIFLCRHRDAFRRGAD